MEDNFTKEKRYAEHKAFIEKVHKKAEDEIKANKFRPNSIEAILQNNPEAIKVFKQKEKSNLWRWKQ